MLREYLRIAVRQLRKEKVYSDQWLSEFSYRLSLGYAYFAICLAILIVLALSTILFQTIEASLTNPSTVLRNE